MKILKNNKERQRNADSRQRWYGRQIKLSGDRSVYADRVEMISKVSQSSNRKGGGCNIIETLTGLADRDKWVSEVSACFLQTLRSRSLSRNATNNPNTVKAHSATGISQSCTFQPSVRGRRKKGQIIFQGMSQKSREKPMVEQYLECWRGSDVADDGVPAHSRTLICETACQRC